VSLGVLGGTFNPIHFAHLRLAEEIREALALERVLFVPAAQPPLKPRVAPAPDRLEMVKLATASNPAFTVIDLELQRDGPSYTVDTLAELGRRFPDEPLWFVMGSDALAELSLWREPETLVTLANLAIVQRPGEARVDPGALLPNGLRVQFAPAPGGLVHESGRELRVIPTTELSLSATDIRERVARGASIRYLVPDSVCEYIAKHRLYEEAP
jgi:nicotinate-nucleotide adenylyltransferase